MAKLQVGDKVRLTANMPKNGMGEVKVGDIGEIIRASPYCTEITIDFPMHNGWHGFPSEVELVEPVEEPTDSVAERLDAIEHRLASIEKLLFTRNEEASTISGPYASADLGEVAIAKGKPEVKFNHEPRQKGSKRGTATQKSRNPNLKRILAIAYAERVTEELEHEVDDAFSDRYVEYHTNEQKGTVTALIKVRDRFYGRDLVVSRGIAKLAPGDVFNEYIGRAIALHRAHGLNIPKELRNAPKPVAPVNGMRVQTNTSYGVMTVADETDLNAGTIRAGLFERLSTDGRGMAIVNDTGALY